MNAILRLPIKKKWFDMIASGEKREEYRKATEYWRRRVNRAIALGKNIFVELRNGYGKDRPSIVREVFAISTVYKQKHGDVVLVKEWAMKDYIFSHVYCRKDWGWPGFREEYFVFSLKEENWRCTFSEWKRRKENK